MAAAVYRFVFAGPSIASYLQSQTGGAALVLGSTAALQFVDVTADTTQLADLQTAMAQVGWTLNATNPVTTPAQQAAAANGYLTTTSAGRLISHQQVVGVTSGPITGSMTPVLLPNMSITRTPAAAASNVRVAFSGNFIGSNNASIATATIFLDGVEQANCQRSGGGGNNSTISVEKWFPNLSIVAHTITIRWFVSSGIGTAVGVHRILDVEEFSA